ncbi:MAG: site-specific DNA-methyltransferase [Candidatus Delongbacteria bacterium]|nr:site-specific DNA-methyltransferase [Candidatus Delongbacteria bacterium]
MTKSKYENYTHGQLIEELKKLSKRKKYGLVWEEERTKEKFETDVEGKLPILTEDKDREIKTNPEQPFNILIEGDNYHALSVLNYTHAKSIDIMYFDPPYNTGAKDWKYNNDYVDSEDSFRHSKWISMMNNRLKLAKNLLKPDGIICVTIDDYEMPRLFMLMEEIFGYNNHLGTLVIRNNPSGRSTVNGISITHEYGLIFGKSKLSKVGRLERTDAQINRYDETDVDGKFEWVNFRKHGGTRAEAATMFYPFYLTDDEWRIPKMEWNKSSKEWTILEQPKNDETVVFPIDDKGKERRWKWGYNSVMDNPSQFKVGLDRKKKPAMYMKARLKNEGVLPLTWWDKKEYSSTAYGTNLLKEIFSEIQVFAYPKSLYAVMDCIKAMSEKKDAIILDIFAGSGTTGHAVLELNKYDNGSRQFILCTNNENNICTDVTYPRLRKVIDGYEFIGNQKDLLFEKKLNPTIFDKIDDFIIDIESVMEKYSGIYDKIEKKIEDDTYKIYGSTKINGFKNGIGGNLKYYKTNFVGSEPTHRNKKLLTEKSIEMLCIHENTFEEVSIQPEIAIYKNEKKYMAILFNEMKIEEFKREIIELKLKVSVYVFSLEGDDFSEDFEDLKNNVKICSIPEAILKVYRRIYETAKPRK